MARLASGSPASATASLSKTERYPVTTAAGGQELEIWAHLVRGARPGPAVAIVSGQHGDEPFTAEFCRYLLERLAGEREALSGRVVIVPVANPAAFEWGTRNTPQDAGNMNRVWPGSAAGGLTEQLADVLVERVVRGSDFVLDYHAEPDAMNIRCLYGRAPDGPYGEGVHAASLATGSPVVFASPFRPGTLAGCAEQLGIPALTPELGGPYPQQGHHHDYGWQELRNLFRHLGMLPGAPDLPGRQWIIHRISQVSARTGGLFYPVVGFDALTTTLPRNAMLGRVLSPYTFEEQEQVLAPFDDNLLMVVRGRMSKVHPGDPLYIIGDAASADVLEPVSS